MNECFVCTTDKSKSLISNYINKYSIMVFEGKRSTWRNHPKLSLANNVRTALPGFGIASALFGTYCVCEWFFKRIKVDK